MSMWRKFWNKYGWRGRERLDDDATLAALRIMRSNYSDGEWVYLVGKTLPPNLIITYDNANKFDLSAFANSWTGRK